MAIVDTAAPRIAAVVVFSPWTDLTLSGRSANDAETRDPIFERAMLEGLATAYLAGADPRDARASPFFGIPDSPPPIAIQVGSAELLLDDARRYAAGAAAKGSEVQLDVFEDLHHVFQSNVSDLPSARTALDRAADFIRRHWESGSR